MLILTNEDAAQVLTMRDTIAALEQLYGDLGRGSAVYRGRTDLFIPTAGSTDEAPSAYQLKTLDGAAPRWNVGSIRVTSDVVAFPLIGGQRRRVKIPTAAGKRYTGLVLLFDSATGELKSILQDGMLQQFSVGAINAIGAKYLSREDSEVVALFGAGGQSVPQLIGLKEVRPIRRVQVYTPTPGEAEKFAKANADALGLEVVAAASPEAALTDADIVVTATNSRVPFFPAEWLKPGMHLSSLQRDEAKEVAIATSISSSSIPARRRWNRPRPISRRWKRSTASRCTIIRQATSTGTISRISANWCTATCKALECRAADLLPQQHRMRRAIFCRRRTDLFSRESQGASGHEGPGRIVYGDDRLMQQRLRR